MFDVGVPKRVNSWSQGTVSFGVHWKRIDNLLKRLVNITGLSIVKDAARELEMRGGLEHRGLPRQILHELLNF